MALPSSRSANRRRVIRPSAKPTRRPLPTAVVLIAVVGLMVLCLCTIPAVLRQQRLARAHERLLEDTRKAESTVTALHRRYGELTRSDYLLRRSRRHLLFQGTTYIARRNKVLSAEQAWIRRTRRSIDARDPRGPRSQTKRK